jgi:hypothetical protein
MEMCRDWRLTPHFGLPVMPAIISGDPKRAGSAMGNPQDAQRSCIVLHDPHLAVGAIQMLRALPNQQQRGHPSCQLAKEVRGFAKRLHTRDTANASPSYLHAMPANSHTRSRYPLFSEVFSFSISIGPIDKRCGSMQEKINGKLNCLGQYFVGLLLGPRLAKDRAISLAPSIRSSAD